MLWLLVVAGYLLGSIPFGYLLVRMQSGGDIRAMGSGNIGATNVARAAGWSIGVATLILDTAKGFFAVWLAGHFSGGSIRFMMYAGLAAILGHIFPVWLKFSGGKGVATALGVFLAICWPAVAVAVAVFAIVRYFLAIRFARFGFRSGRAAAARLCALCAGARAARRRIHRHAAGGVLVIIKHRWNIERLMIGTEPRFEMRPQKIVKKIAIIGGGSWGTALAIALTRSSRPHRIALWAHSADVVEMLRTKRVNEIYLPGFELPAEVEVTGALEKALAGADIVLGVMPSAHAREMYRAMRPHLEPQSQYSSARPKGLEPATHARISEVIAEEIGSANRTDFLRASLFFPAQVLPPKSPQAIPPWLSSHRRTRRWPRKSRRNSRDPRFRLYTNDDVIGTEIAGAVKNVIAIAAGVCTGLGLGTNTMAALVTRGLAEMTRLAVALGGRRDTLAGLAGVGDLILTSTGALSRNRSVGIELGKGRELGEILGATRMVAEGVGSAAATLELARRAGIEMPITEQVHAVLDRRPRHPGCHPRTDGAPPEARIAVSPYICRGTACRTPLSKSPGLSAPRRSIGSRTS